MIQGHIFVCRSNSPLNMIRFNAMRFLFRFESSLKIIKLSVLIEVICGLQTGTRCLDRLPGFGGLIPISHVQCEFVCSPCTLRVSSGFLLQSKDVLCRLTGIFECLHLGTVIDWYPVHSSRLTATLCNKSGRENRWPIV